MAVNNVANAALMANTSAVFSRLNRLAKVVPVKLWRMAAMAIALVWVCSSFVDLFWALVPTPKMPAPTVIPGMAKVQMSTAGKKLDLASLQGLNLLGSFDPNAKVDQPAESIKPIAGAPLAKTKLKLELHGVMAGHDSAKSWAIIGKSDSQKLYQIDEKLDGVRGVKIADIFPTKVILDNNGKLEELWLYGKDGKDVGSSYIPSSPVSKPSVKKKKGSSAVVDQSEVMSVKSIGDVVRFMVATEDGRMIGYKVRPGRKRKLFDQVGLKTDDIVISVNGIEVNEPQKVREVYQALKNATEADLEVMRDGNSHSIHISMSPEG